MEQLRKRADEAVELRVRCAKLTEDNRICIERLRELEQETRFSGSLRSQAETQRMQAADARLEATEATRRADALDSELRKVREELTGTVREKMLLVTELNRLRACCEELQMCVNPTRGVEEEIVSLSSNANVQLSPAIQSQMLNLQEELSRLRTSLSTMEGHMCNISDREPEPTCFVTQGFQTNPVTKSVPESPNVTPAPMQNGLDEVESEPTVSVEHELSALRSQLAQKERDMLALEQKYRGYLWKAREVIRVLEREQRQIRDNGCVGGGDPRDGSTETSVREIERLRGLLVEKEDVIEKLELHHEQARRHRDAEEHILVSAWYNLIGSFTRNAIEQRIQARTEPQQLLPGAGMVDRTNNCHPLSSTQDASFLERQRELHLKPPRGLTSVVVASK
ncbi:putative Hook [Fasciola gigantica]|uniref:Putative Hook n=1 Tax=Fasciola gigantica TaxID=46835 RepID=A0A504YQY9_FASGI|nr:putative Hook [Fasciola gigantica]